jgi:hypothetical protein
MPKAKSKPVPKTKPVVKPVLRRHGFSPKPKDGPTAERMRQATKPSRSKKPAAQRMREATRLTPKKKARPRMPDDPKPRADEIVPLDAPTEYPPVGVVVSTGTAWDTSIPSANVALTGQNTDATFRYMTASAIQAPQYSSTVVFGIDVAVAGTTYLGTQNPSIPGTLPATVVQPGGALDSPAITVAGSPVITTAMLDPADVEARLAALEAAIGVTPPADDPRRQTRATLNAEAQTNQDLNDEIFAQQLAEAQRVQDIFNPPVNPSS